MTNISDNMGPTGLEEGISTFSKVSEVDSYSGRFGDPFGDGPMRKASNLEAGCRVRHRVRGEIGELVHLAAGAPVRGAFVRYDNGSLESCSPDDLERI
jgi:hypothetical protein